VNKKLRLILSVLLLAWLAWRTDWVQVGRAFAQLRLGWWLAAFGLYLFTQVVSGVRWQLLARPLGLGRPLRQFVAFYFIGMYFNLFLPTSVGGDVVRAWYLDGGSGRKLAAFLSVVFDRFSGLLVLLALACAAVALCPIALPAWVPISVWGTVGGAAVVLAGLALVDLRASPAARLPGAAKVLHKIDDLRSSGRVFLRPGLLLSTTALSLVVQAANVLVVWLVGLAIDAPVPAAYYWILVPMVTLLTLLPISLNGMGVREGGMVLFLAPLAVGEGTALSLAFLWFAVFTAASLCGGAVYLFGSFARPEVRPDHEPVRRDSDQGRARQPRAAA
jgi:uncharacterized membrane protein YbhN (UPF0104 family)